VEVLQDALGITADGEFGPATARAVRRFKRSNGMNVDGIAGPKVLAALGITVEGDTGPTGPTGPTGGGADPTTEPTASGEAATAVAAAQSAIGSPYASAGTTPDGFDCSGLTRWAYKKAGITLPHSSFDQYLEGDDIEQAAIAPGDLVFFDTAGAGASHVGIATSATTVISATSSRGVIEHPIDDDYWGEHYVGARSIA
jgi:cell wall-associated NlpC family hydrolase